MGLETGTYINDLNSANPLGTDQMLAGDDHLRLIKTVLKNTFPGMAGAFSRVQTKATGYTAVANDNTSLIDCSAGLTLALTAAATLGNQWMIVVSARGGAVTIDPDASEQINGASTLALTQGSFAIVWCTGSAFYAAVITNPAGVYQPLDTELTAIAALATTDGNVIVGNGSTWVAESGATARTSLGAAADANTLTIWIPAGAMVPSLTNGASFGTVELATNDVMLKTLDFDPTTQEFAQFGIRMPKGWNESTVTAEFVWSHPSTSTNFGVVWQLQGYAFSDSDPMDSAWGTAQTATDTGGTTDDAFISPTTAAITIGGTPAEEDYVMFRVARVPANGSDTMAVDARLHGVTINYTTTSLNDA